MDDFCSRLWEIDPYREGRLGNADAKSFERHLVACEACRTQLKRDERLGELARALPDDGPTELGLRRLRGRVLRDVATGVAPPAPRRLRAGLAALVLGVGLAVTAWALTAHRAPPAPDGTVRLTTLPQAPAPDEAKSAPSAEAFAGAVVPSGAARWSQTRAQGVEQVVLEEGMLRLHVRPQVVGERFLVMLPDGELEVRGTTFEVKVERGATTRVHVDDGVVDVRLRGREPRRLGEGETWNVAASAGSASPPAARAAPATRSSAAASEGGEAYAAAIALLSEGRNDEAAAAFHAFVLSEPRAPQAEDASFLEAVALARMGRSDAAALAAEHHLASFPASFHRREAAILVARAAAHRGECGKARVLLAPWTGPSPDADAEATLRACEGR
jgi:hypothetical protein